ncbi:monoacylglycerol lipase ABHD6-like [Rhodamnia argentea]|uniref:Monoacylglycerol lipase ABHD6-like n=1 Tax=Rhodamnia argentea TaxID=178133 RepID=A0A8B8PR73_9MYRT|nr:monoacylglycerol lipase ABHD6-like [Rhodamnia argentea]
MSRKSPSMSKCFSFTASRDWFYRYWFTKSGLRSVSTGLGDGTIMHCWVPKSRKPSKPNLVLVHGFGANAMWQYAEALHHFTPRYNVYVPDLIFFGRSYTSLPDRTESFQARCLMRLMGLQGVERMSMVGISYGGFVAYSMAVQYPQALDRLVLCCTGVCLEEKDLKAGLFPVKSLEEAKRVLMPQTPEKLRELMRVSFVRPATGVPSFFLSDFIKVMCSEFVEEKGELIQEILKDRGQSNLPKIRQPTLLVWGEQDQIFPLELGHRLKRHIGDNAELVVIKNAGHAVNLEKPKEFIKHLKLFLL